VTSLKPGAAPRPEENRPIDTPPTSKVSRRRIVRLTAIADATPPPAAPRTDEVRPSGPRHARGRSLPSSRDDWLVLAERVVGDWAATLRSALLLGLAVTAVIMVIGLVFGTGAALATTFLALLVFLAGRRRGGPVRR
jgi:hypothetical protein